MSSLGEGFKVRIVDKEWRLSNLKEMIQLLEQRLQNRNYHGWYGGACSDTQVNEDSENENWDLKEEEFFLIKMSELTLEGE